ncbi:unnamed protein product [Bursaphelenchus okinawaensis]|uniref:Fungal lipase-type domain-containing protein n=1 Tax=Bursaphelenchus okinawaensis TaxID=465554 RepID=A0A811L1N8_9BILA|nr:unnamed protein product [Bursaphelenchus okinawaensis]CAG9114887.1 unnamed protein product [Bursaphelenchus okinawaensis]
MAAAAYSTWPEKCVNNVFVDANVTKSVASKCVVDLGDYKLCYGFTGVAHEDKVVFLAYRGTAGFFQLITETYQTAFQPMVEAKIGGNVSEYFYGVYENLQTAGLNEEVLALANQYPDYRIWITGHSLGGALASISAAELVKIQNISSDRILIITFGEPRTGDSEYANNYDALVPNTYRVVNQRDIVPHLPPLRLFDYIHHSQEVWYEYGMANISEYKTCPAESCDCSNQYGDLYSVADHLTYYMEFIVGYGWSGCGAIAASIKQLL